MELVFALKSLGGIARMLAEKAIDRSVVEALADKESLPGGDSFARDRG
jgi:hypothetical protein